MQYTPEQIVITPGGKPIIFLPILALVDHGDEVIYPNPGYPIYESAINFAGGKAVPLVYSEERDFRFDIAELEAKINPKTKLLILNSPPNPTGGVLEESDLKRIAELCVKNDVIVLSDEVYCKIIYEGKHHSIATYPGMKERTILMDAHSKTYAMTGWRLGFAAMPKPIAEKLTKLNTNVYSHATTFVQIAGIEALRGPQDKVTEMVATFNKRRDAIVDGLNEIKGFTCLKPKGAFYVFPNIKGTGMKSKELADKLLNEAGVACLAGTCFGSYGEGYLRFSYANSLTNIEKALDRIKGVLAHLRVAPGRGGTEPRRAEGEHGLSSGARGRRVEADGEEEGSPPRRGRADGPHGRGPEAPLGEGIDEVIVVLGHRADEVGAALSQASTDERIELVGNRPVRGGHGDVPGPRRERLLVGDGRRHRRSRRRPVLPSRGRGGARGDATRRAPRIAVPVFAGRRGHPVLFDGEYRGPARGALRRHGREADPRARRRAVVEVELDDDGFLVDIDEGDDYEAVRTA